MPARFGKWNSIYKRFNRWAADGTGEKLLAQLQRQADATGRIDWVVSFDSTIARVHQHSVTLARDAGGSVDHKNPWFEPHDHAIGRSRSGLTTKLNLIANGRGRLLGMIITGGNVNDTTMVTTVLEEAPHREGQATDQAGLGARDEGYPSKANRAWLRECCIVATIPERDDQIARSLVGRPISVTSSRNATTATTSSNVASTGSSNGAVSRCALTNSPATSAPRSTSPRP